MTDQDHLVLKGDMMIADAILQMVSYTRNSVESYKAGVGEYEHLSARGVLYTLGFNTEDADTILEYISKNGFSHCLDHNIKTQERQHDGTVRDIYPDQQVCYWGADQLHSRLTGVALPREWHEKHKGR